MIQNLYGIGSTVKLVRLRLTLCNPMDCSLPGSYIREILQVSILEWVDISSPGDLPNQGSNLGLLLCRQILYHLGHQGSPRNAAEAVPKGKFIVIQACRRKQDISQINNPILHLKQVEKEEQKPKLAKGNKS